MRVHGDRRWCHVLPRGVRPEAGEQGIDSLVHGETGNLFSHEVLADRTVDEAAQALPAVDVGEAEGRSNVIKRIFVKLAQPGWFGSEVVPPRSDKIGRAHVNSSHLGI